MNDERMARTGTGPGNMRREMETLLLCLFLVIAAFPLCLVSSPTQPIYPQRALQEQRSSGQVVLSSTTMSRRQAIIEYVAALQSPEGYFHAYLSAPPPFDLDGTPPTYSSARYAYYTLRYINALDAINWTATTGFLHTLINQDTGLVNDSKQIGPQLFSCSDALTFFQEIGANDGINIEANVAFLAGLQQPDGGFAANPYDPQTNIVQTYFAINGLRAAYALYRVNISRVRDFVLDCYHDDGGFGIVASADSDITTLPAGLCLVNILDLWSFIDVNKTLSYILQFWNDTKGCDSSEDMLYTYYLAWSLAIIGRTAAISSENLTQWLLKCQHSLHGEFVGYPDAEPDNERLVCAFYATKLLSLYNATDRLDGNITVEEPPHWEIPQWWLDYVREKFGTTTTDGIFNPADFAFFMAVVQLSALVLLVVTPAILIAYKTRSRQKKWKELKDG